MKGVNIFLADGFEDIEALSVCDVLRRGGVDVKLTGISGESFVRSAHGVMFGVDNNLDEINLSADGVGAGDVMIFPGGLPGARNLADCRMLIDAMKAHYAAGGTVAAICAAPGLVLSRLDALEGVEFTCYDGFEPYLQAMGAAFRPEPAVCCGRIITGRGPGYAVDFALAILGRLRGESAAAAVASGMYLK